MSTGYCFCCGWGNFLDGLGHFTVELVGCYIKCCTVQNRYIVLNLLLNCAIA